MFEQPKKMQMTRKEFYERVWAKPARILAAEFGISDVMIAKLCKKYDIPKPGLGYWTRVENGYRDPVTPLPSNENPQLETVEISLNAGDAYRIELSDKTNELLAREGHPDYIIKIPDRLTNLHPLVADLRDSLAKTPQRHNGMVYPRKELHVRTSKHTADRAIRILAALTTAFKKRGFEFGTDLENGTSKGIPTVTIQGQPVSFKLLERARQKRVNSLDEIEDKDAREGAKWFFRPGQMVQVPTEELYIQIESYVEFRCRKSWSDKDSLPLEDQLNEVMKGLIIASEGVRLHEERLAERRRKFDEEYEAAKRREEKRQARKNRMEAVTKLAGDINEYRRVQQLKAELAEMLASQPMNAEAIELMKWLEEYLSTGSPLDQFLQLTIKPLIEEAQNK